MSNDFMENILASFNKNVKENNTNVFNNLQPAKEIPTYLNDPSIQHNPIEIPKRLDVREQLSEIGQITRAYNSLRIGGETGKLSDQFRDTQTKEIKSRTNSSLAETLASYSRYISILQATA